jgi:hypothetical protein
MPPPIPGRAAAQGADRLAAFATNPAMLREVGGSAAQFAARPLVQGAHKALGAFCDNVRALPPRPGAAGHGKIAEGIRGNNNMVLGKLTAAFQEIASAPNRQAGMQAVNDRGLGKLLGNGVDPQIQGHFRDALEAVLPRAQAGSSSLTPAPLRLEPPSRGSGAALHGLNVRSLDLASPNPGSVRSRLPAPTGRGGPGLRSLAGAAHAETTPGAVPLGRPGGEAEPVMQLRGADGEHLAPSPAPGHLSPDDPAMAAHILSVLPQVAKAPNREAALQLIRDNNLEHLLGPDVPEGVSAHFANALHEVLPPPAAPGSHTPGAPAPAPAPGDGKPPSMENMMEMQRQMHLENMEMQIRTGRENFQMQHAQEQAKFHDGITQGLIQTAAKQAMEQFAHILELAVKASKSGGSNC